MRKIIIFFKKIRYFIFILIFLCILFLLIQNTSLQKIIISNEVVNSAIIEKKLNENNDILSYTNFSKLVFHIGNEDNYESINNFFITNMCFKLNDLIYYCESKQDFIKNYGSIYEIGKQNNNSYNIVNKTNNQRFTYIKNENNIVFILK